MKLFYFSFAFCFLLSCNNHSEDNISEPITLQIDQIYKTGGGIKVSGKSVEMAYHYLILKEYTEKDGSSWNKFIDFADNYRDTVQSTLPLSSITICKPNKIPLTSNLAGGDGWLEFKEQFILTIDYSHQTMHDKLADIESLVFWQNGKPFSVNLLTDKRKKKLNGYFDSSGEYSDKWIDRYKGQVLDPDEDSIINTLKQPASNR